MKRSSWILTLFLLVGMALPAAAQQNIIVRDKLGLSGLQTVCRLLNCKISLSLGDPAGQLFLVSSPKLLNLNTFVALLLGQVGVVDAEVDQNLFLISATAGPIPESLYDSTPLSYYGTPVWNGYVNQPASQIVHVAAAQRSFHVTGAGLVALIDTGVDTNHPTLQPVLVSGYNFIDNTPTGDEKSDLSQSSAAVLDGGGPGQPTYVNQYTVAALSQSSAAVLDGGSYSDFGHGTMTAGLVHLVAPTAQIMPLKAFAADGSGYVSNIIRAVYYAVGHGGKVISMSFSFSPGSNEMGKAISYANSKNVICVAAVGNNGEDVVMYPAAYPSVMGVASTSDFDTRSTFSNYGSDVWVAAPGEGVVSTYPYGTFAAGWGTSFSTPLVSGTAALLVDVSAQVNAKSAAAAIAHAKRLSSDMGNGRLNVYNAVQAWSAAAK